MPTKDQEIQLNRLFEAFGRGGDNSSDLSIDFIKMFGTVTEKEVDYLLTHMQDYMFFRSFFENSEDGMMIIGEDDTIHMCNNTMLKWLNKSLVDVVGKTTRDVFGYDEREPYLTEEIERQLYSEGKYRFDWHFLAPDGSQFWLEVSTNVLKDNHGNFFASANVFRDITEKKKLEEQLSIFAQTDQLTGIYNRRHFFEVSDYKLNEAKRYGLPISLAILDLDNFKHINDDMGHLAGDYVLEEHARIISRAIRETDVFGRYGGEEFMILFTHTSTDMVEEVAERLRKTIESHDFEFNTLKIPVTASIGLYCCDNYQMAQTPLMKMIEIADQELYHAKDGGKNRVDVFRC